MHADCLNCVHIPARQNCLTGKRDLYHVRDVLQVNPVIRTLLISFYLSTRKIYSDKTHAKYIRNISIIVEKLLKKPTKYCRYGPVGPHSFVLLGLFLVIFVGMIKYGMAYKINTRLYTLLCVFFVHANVLHTYRY